eukprot:8526652-Pyramimonas_sp.AAC.1
MRRCRPGPNAPTVDGHDTHGGPWANKTGGRDAKPLTANAVIYWGSLDDGTTNGGPQRQGPTVPSESRRVTVLGRLTVTLDSRRTSFMRVRRENRVPKDIVYHVNVYDNTYPPATYTT